MWLATGLTLGGVALAGGTVLLASWLMAAAMGPEHFATAQAAAG